MLSTLFRAFRRPRVGHATLAGVPTLPPVNTFLSDSGGLIFVDRETGRVAHRSGNGRSSAPAVGLFVPDARPDIALLFPLSATRRIMTVEHDEAAEVLSFILEPSTTSGMFHLRHPLRRRWVCAAPSEPDRLVPLAVNREAPSGWERFRTAWVNQITVGGRASELLLCLARLFALPLSPETVIDWLSRENPSVLAGCATAIVRLLDPEGARRVAAHALADAAFRATLTAVVPDQRWMAGAFAPLCAWLADRPSAATLAIGIELDFLGRDEWRARGAPTAGALLATQLRATVEPRRTLCIVATARNEGIYFVEWIAHYRAIGVEHFFIYGNDNDDGSDALLDALAAAGVITFIRNRIAPGTDGQLKAYAHALSWLPQTLDYRWTLVVDLDELVIFAPGQTSSLPDLLARRLAAGATSVSFSWLMFTPGLEKRWSPRPLIDRFRFREPVPNTEVKTAFQTRLHALSHPHDPTPLLGVVPVHQKPSGMLHHWEGRTLPPSNGVPEYDVAWVNHYFYKSFEEWIWKVSRNRGGYTLRTELAVEPRQLEGFLKWRGVGARVVRDERALTQLAGVESEWERLRRLPGVADAEDAVHDAFRSRVDRLARSLREAFEHDDALSQADRVSLRMLLAEPEAGRARDSA